uniref:Mediator of RNA polymerase II transcription subunit 12 n=1 Tax=Lygus hesperus TaxID=30085 RepID=A0A0A9W0S2_LYGHE
MDEEDTYYCLATLLCIFLLAHDEERGRENNTLVDPLARTKTCASPATPPPPMTTLARMEPMFLSKVMCCAHCARVPEQLIEGGMVGFASAQKICKSLLDST